MSDKYNLGNDDNLQNVPKKEPFKPGDPLRSHAPVIDRTGITSKQKFALENQDDMSFGLGMFGEPSIEAKPTYNQLPSETLVDSQVNAQVSIGPYNPGGILSPSIASGETKNATIDLVAGRLGSYATTVVKDEERLDRFRSELKSTEFDLATLITRFTGGGDVSPERIESAKAKYFQQQKALSDLEASVAEDRVYCNSSYKLDAARITVSQKGNVDEDFGIRPGGIGTSRNKSFVAVKGDDVRLVGREGIKIVTGTDDENSQGAKNDLPRGIDLIAGNDDQDMQSMVKGENLIECIDEMLKNISDVNGILIDFITQQMIYNSAIAFHTHTVATAAGPGIAAPSLALIPVWIPSVFQQCGVTFPSIIINKYNMARNYLVYMTPKPGIKPGGFNKYILSTNNRTN